MATKKKTGGRVKGTANKRTQEVIDRLASLKCDPIEGMALIALGKAKCPECAGKKVQLYSMGVMNYVVDTRDGMEMTCQQCSGTGFEPTPLELRGRMFAELAQYIAPKRKAIEHSTGGEEEMTLNVILKESDA